MLKIGVIGAGHLGKIHLKQIKEIPHYQLVGFFDTDAAVAKKVSEELGVPSFSSAVELIKNVDVVDVVVPTVAHCEYASLALRQFKHVFIEKPLAVDVEEAKSLVALAREANVKTQVGHVERFNPAFLAVKDRCDNPMFIEAHRLAVFNPRGTDVSVILDLMIHDIDIVLSLVKSDVKRISASGVSVVSDTPDIANARIEFDNGCVANLTASRISLKNMRKIRMFQKDAYISMDLLSHKTEVVKIKEIADDEEEGMFSMVIDQGNGRGKKQLSVENPPVQPNNAIRMELQEFAESIIHNKPTIVTIEDGAKALDTAAKIIERINFIQPE
ncbi:MAG TPA: Gfo/Idh/MocA family oxidoreductase [Bacteroidia bacterium]|jgi:predicted dehydrogenase|nr:Gfo/Idh/MocA family oxidoreductase [Bacteroidia bacterium]